MGTNDKSVSFQVVVSLDVRGDAMTGETSFWNTFHSIEYDVEINSWPLYLNHANLVTFLI